MIKFFIFILLLSLPNVIANDLKEKFIMYKTIYVSRSVSLGPKHIVSYKNKFKLESVRIWQSDGSSCNCSLDYGYSGASSLSCNIPGGYRVQFGFNCDYNNSREKAAYAFMCMNWYVWCSDPISIRIPERSKRYF